MRDGYIILKRRNEDTQTEVMKEKKKLKLKDNRFTTKT